MSTVQFNYAAPASLEEALTLLQQNPGANVLAGGLNLVNRVKLHRASPSFLVDLRKIQGLRGIRGGGANEALEIGALTSFAEIAADSRVRERHAALAQAALSIGDPQVRSQGTLGGNLAAGEPGADLPPVTLALAANIRTTGPYGTYTVAADDFFTGGSGVALSPGVIITSVEFPAQDVGAGSAYEKWKHPASGFAICGVAALVVRGSDGAVGQCRVALAGPVGGPVRLRRVEARLTGSAPTPENIAAAAGEARNEGLSFASDFFASAEYRAHLAGVLTQRALARASALG